MIFYYSAGNGKRNAPDSTSWWYKKWVYYSKFFFRKFSRRFCKNTFSACLTGKFVGLFGYVWVKKTIMTLYSSYKVLKKSSNIIKELIKIRIGLFSTEYCVVFDKKQYFLLLRIIIYLKKIWTKLMHLLAY